MAGTEISNRQRTWLTGELDIWQSQGLVSGDQVVQILGLYPTQSEVDEKNRSAALLAVMGVAAVLVGLGVLLLIGYNWNAMPDPLKLVLIFSAVIGTQSAGFFLRFRRHSVMWSELVFLLGCLFYGAGIFLVAQILNLNAHYPDGMW